MAWNNERGFTLLEVLIAITILLISLTAVFSIESQSISSTTKSKQRNIVTMLAKNKMVEAEILLQGKPFNEVDKEESGQFEPPYEDYRWQREIKEVEFPSLNVGSGGGGEGADGESANDGIAAQGATYQAEMLSKIMSKYVSESLREVTINVLWKEGVYDQKYSVSTYWVDLNGKLQITP